MQAIPAPASSVTVVLNQFFLFRDGAPTLLLLSGSYQPGLVLLSVVVASLTSAMALQMAGMAGRTANLASRQAILASGAAAMGGGVWSMHFIGMLAFQLCTEVQFDATWTVASMLPALLASWVALALLSRGKISRWQWVQGGVLVGAGIGAMHYMGMAAMRLNAELRYDPLWFAASIVVAVLLAMLALWIRFGLEGRLRRLWTVLLGGVVMGAAISGMHYTAMAAARFISPGDQPCNALIGGSGAVALGVTVVTLAISTLTGGANGLLGYRRLTRQLRSEKRRMQAMLDTAVDGVITINGRGSILSFNGAAERLFGWTADEVLGRNVKLLMPEPHHGQHDGYLQRHLETGEARIIGVGRDVVGQHKTGRPLPIRLAIGRVEQQQQAQQEEGAEEALFVAFVTDISVRQRMEQALRDSELQYRSLIANSPGVNFRCRIDADWSMVVISDSVQVLTGWPAQDFLAGRASFAPLIHEGDRARVNDEVERALAADEPYALEYRLNARDGTERWVSETGRGVRNEAGEPQWIDGVIVDISEAKRLQLALEEAKGRAEAAAAAKGAFLANMSHEIRTPMNAILGFTELLLDTGLSEVQRKYLNTLRGSARSLLGLLNDILDTAKLDKGAVELERRDFSLRAVCEQTLASLRLAAARKGLALRLDYPAEAPQFFKGDALRIQQVLLNLVGNAIKFTEHGSVALAMGQEADGQIHLSVSDTGIGIAADRLERIFDAFAQADASTTRRFGGTGLGTTISRQLVERMGGRITVESVLGEGSCFHVWLPLPAGDPVSAEAAVEELPALPPLQVLVADDVEQNGELMQLMLSRDGHRVQLVSDGMQALQAFSEGEFDVVLMDIHMPQLDGLGATRRIRNFELAQGRARTPIVALTASVLEEDRQAALTAGMDGFAVKPVEPVRLYSEMARVLGLSPADAEPVVAVSEGQSPLDCEQGVRLWGSAPAWRRALRRFAEEQKDGAPRLLALLKAGEHLEARAMAHRWRGVAGSLALPQLLAASARLEDALRRDQRELLPELGRAVVVALDQVLMAIEELAAGTPSALAPLTTPGEASAATVLDRLQRALEHGELEDQALVALQGLLGAQRCAPLVEALDQFDFDAALKAVQTLKSESERQA
ncbi:MHYT domain-containing protein [Pelomonas sp. SE-A7]|uniref:MHYT domain-containing protein n=1 Tax=Pelomonas sp. SE-A7 TaxID=3054953 RepID=UPI00259D244A|nr:MHYT domain-containing protein [Pelomonas sp. SE-A7]MDM4766318.1 MHYT domain-containing protein [Pelomonas sp. SE-A7]